MTLTEHSAPWPADGLAHAASLNVRAAARRWEDLYVALEALTTDTTSADFDGLAVRLVQEFLDMLTEEGLIPVKPLAGDELTDLWSRSQAGSPASTTTSERARTPSPRRWMPSRIPTGPRHK